MNLVKQVLVTNAKIVLIVYLITLWIFFDPVWLPNKVWEGLCTPEGRVACLVSYGAVYYTSFLYVTQKNDKS